MLNLNILRVLSWFESMFSSNTFFVDMSQLDSSLFNIYKYSCLTEQKELDLH